MKQVWIGLLVGMMLSVSLSAAQVNILCYHTFLGHPNVDTDFSVAEFETQIASLQKKGFHFVTFQQMRAGSVQGTRNVFLVIDDGNISAYSAYTAVLKPRKIKAMFAIYPGIVAGHRSFAMTWDQLKQLKKDGNEFASHGYFHEFLNDKLKATRPNEFDNEVILSKSMLEKELGIPIDVYVYPFGVCTTVGKRALKTHGYSFAMTIISRPTLLPLSANPNPLELPRTMLTRATAAGVISRL
jgi:peptidoglycan/xylan/chitin deacetylase (PgdA/CDA1 family)